MMNKIKPRSLLLILGLVLLVSYSFYQARSIILGPQISITNITDGEVVENPLVIIEGRARNISWISLNDRQIFTDEEGRWSEKLIVSSGTSIITVKARDRFGRERKKSLQVILNKNGQS